MAARLNRMHSEQVRAKIQASVIIDRLQKHIAGDLEMTASQISAAQILLDRSVPKLAPLQSDTDKLTVEEIVMEAQLAIQAAMSTQ